VRCDAMRAEKKGGEKKEDGAVELVGSSCRTAGSCRLVSSPRQPRAPEVGLAYGKGTHNADSIIESKVIYYLK